MITFKKDVELEIVESFDEETEEAVKVNETFKAGEFVDGDIVEDKGDHVDIQFGDGSMAYNVAKDSFDIV